MSTRREFLATTAGIAVTAGVPFPSGAQPLRTKIERPGMQLYTLNAEMRKDPSATIAQVAAIGYKEIEFAYYFGNTPEKLRELLDANKLIAPSAHCSLDDLEMRYSVCEHAGKVLGHDTLVVPNLDRTRFATIADWKAMALRFNTLGRKTRDSGMRFGYHNHDFEFTPINGTRPYDVLLSETDPALVDFEMDLYWITKGGGSPVEYFRKYPGRFPVVHAKDTNGAPDYKMLDPGAGTIDFKSIFAQWKVAGIRHFYAEVDNPADSVATMKASYKFLSTIEF